MSHVTIRLNQKWLSFSHSAKSLMVSEAKVTLNGVSLTRLKNGFRIEYPEHKLDVNVEMNLLMNAGEILFLQNSLEQGGLLQIYGPNAKVTGKLNDAQVKGHGVFIHQVQKKIFPFKISKKWIMCELSTKICGVTVIGFDSLGFKGTACVFWEGETIITTDVTVESTASSVKFIIKLKEKEIMLFMPSMTNVEEFDLLGAMPWLLKKAVQAFVTKPVAYHYTNEMQMTVDQKQEKAMGFVEFVHC